MKTSRENLMIILFLSIVTSLLILLALLLFLGQWDRNRILLRYELEKSVASIIYAYREGTPLNQEELALFGLSHRVLGLGLYQEDGTPLFRYGAAPPSLPWHKDQELVTFTQNRGNRSLIYIRRLFPSFRPRKSLPESFWREEAESGRRKPPYLVYMEIQEAGFWRKQGLLLAGLLSFLVPLALAMILVGHLSLKNLSYRRRLASQAGLVKLGEAARTLSHEIKNPLSAIKLRVEILKRLIPGQAQEDLDIIAEEVKRLDGLTERIGEFLKNPQGNPQPIPLKEFLPPLTARFGDRVQLLDDFPADTTILFDQERLRSVMDNLIRNGLESDPQSGMVEVKVERDRDRVRVAVLDRGTGIDPKQLSKVFDPFFTTKAKGSGIGLSIAKGFVEAAGGTLEIDPRDRGGTAVVIRLKGKTK